MLTMIEQITEDAIYVNVHSKKIIETEVNNTSGIIGVSWKQKSNKWRAYIVIDGKQKHLGEYSVKEHAIKARLKAEAEWFGDYSPQRNLFKEYGIEYNLEE